MDLPGPAFAPFAYLSGVGLLILSTSARFINVKNELLKLSPEECREQSPRVQREMRRARMLRNALNSLYVSVATFSLASLLGSWSESFPGPVRAAEYILTTAGVAAVVFASIQLTIDSMLSLEILRAHTQDADQNSTGR